MRLVLNISQEGGGPAAFDTTKTLETGSLIIGRSPDAEAGADTWTLPDAMRVLSKVHCRIAVAGDGFQITDCSTNGVFVNRASVSLGKGNAAILSHGDVVCLGDYEMSVTLVGVDVTSSIDDAPTYVDPGPHDIGAEAAALGDLLSEEAPPAPKAPPTDFFRDESSAPSKDDAAWRNLLDDSGPKGPAAPQLDKTPAHMDHFQPPDIAPAIPDDWHEEGAAAPLSAPLNAQQPRADQPFPSSGVEQGSAAPPPPVEIPDAQPPAPNALSSTADADALLRAFCQGAGLRAVPGGDPVEVMRLQGALFRQAMAGVMEILAARGQTKNEFRMSQTMIRPGDNNPLKFSLSVSDAIAAMLGEADGYLPPEKAMREAIDDVKLHQVAVLAGMQKALLSFMRRFDPAKIESQYQGEKGIGALMGANKSKAWDEYKRLYAQLAAAVSDDFHDTIGRDFSRAYEEHVSKLKPDE